MSTPGNPFAAIAAGQDQGQTAPDSPTGNPFTAIAATVKPAVEQPTGISRLWTLDNPDPSLPPVNNLQQIKDAALGAGKTVVKGSGMSVTSQLSASLT